MTEPWYRKKETIKKVSANLDPASEAKSFGRKEWDEIEDEVDQLTDSDIRVASAAKYTYSNAGSGFCKATDVGHAGRDE